jgi:hypothetical protein
MLSKRSSRRAIACDTVPVEAHGGQLLWLSQLQAKAMSDSKQHTRYKGVDRRAPRPDFAGTGAGPGMTRDAYVNLLKRSEKIGGRHSAITNSLYSWHSYKTWAEKMRGAWDDKK